MRSEKHQYSEHEAANQLGISVERLREIVKSHILNGEDGARGHGLDTYQASDIVLLRILAQK